MLLASTLELTSPAPSLVELRVAAIRRVLPAITPPLELRVVPFRYRVCADSVEPVTPKCRHARAR
ncbi:MAG TPA: hypothetical protein VN181_07695, partial [Thermoanaerobaculia bacterium]|nr:hypothetical protein [Thermoanaerobaculia bacterium]